MDDFDIEDLIKQAKIQAMNELIEEGFASGVGTRTFAEIRQAARDGLKAEGKFPTE
ncbi:MAG: hypothetical protein JWR84_3618 [Caulobacter sp.]|nr:hypothetical protein [Caulobacter sp.]